MLERIANSWQLVKASAAVLRADKELVIFPIISAIGAILVTVTFFVPMIVGDVLEGMFGAAGGAFGYIVLFFYYLVQYFVIFFANAALVGAAMIRLEGGDPTVADGFRIARERAGAILGYAAISATVGLILRVLSERRGVAGVIGNIVVALVGLAWNLATFLAVPVLVVEGVGPVDAVKRSATLLKKTWGEQIAGNFSIGAIFGLAIFLVILLGAGLVIVAVGTGSVTFIVTAVLLVVVTVVALALANATLSGIYTAAVYQYATDGKQSRFFAPELVEGAFKVKG